MISKFEKKKGIREVRVGIVGTKGSIQGEGNLPHPHLDLMSGLAEIKLRGKRHRNGELSLGTRQEIAKGTQEIIKERQVLFDKRQNKSMLTIVARGPLNMERLSVRNVGRLFILIQDQDLFIILNAIRMGPEQVTRDVEKALHELSRPVKYSDGLLPTKLCV